MQVKESFCETCPKVTTLFYKNQRENHDLAFGLNIGYIAVVL
jgi:hypothetical protein